MVDDGKWVKDNRKLMKDDGRRMRADNNNDNNFYLYSALYPDINLFKGV